MPYLGGGLHVISYLSLGPCPQESLSVPQVGCVYEPTYAVCVVLHGYEDKMVQNYGHELQTN